MVGVKTNERVVVYCVMASGQTDAITSKHRSGETEAPVTRFEMHRTAKTLFMKDLGSQVGKLPRRWPADQRQTTHMNPTSASSSSASSWSWVLSV